MPNDKARVDTAHKMGVEVEAELGHEFRQQSDDFTNTSLFTDPDDGKVYRDYRDSLAVAVGGHGLLATPSLDFDRYRKSTSPYPYPCYAGGSDIPDDQLKRSIECG